MDAAVGGGRQCRWRRRASDHPGWGRVGSHAGSELLHQSETVAGGEIADDQALADAVGGVAAGRSGEADKRDFGGRGTFAG